MKKNLFCIIFSAIVLLNFSSCKKDSKTTTTTPTPTPTFNWTGTAPFSVKLDGVSYVVAASDISVFDVLGYLNINADLSDDLSVALSLQSAIVAGEYTTPSPNNITHTNTLSGFQGAGLNSGCKIKIIQNTPTLIEGKFYGTVKAVTGNETHTLAEGYFKVTK
jgi:hypothetical protein